MRYCPLPQDAINFLYLPVTRAQIFEIQLSLTTNRLLNFVEIKNNTKGSRKNI